MQSLWDYPDFDDHEVVHFVTDRETGLRAIVAVHSTHLGPGAGGTRLWHYPDKGEAVRDVLRLSRGMSYKNAMAGLSLGGGKAVILADEARTKSPEMFAAFGRAVEGLCGKYVTAEDVGITVPDLVEVSKHTSYVSGLPVASGAVGGDPGPHTSYGVFLGIKAAVRNKLGKESLGRTPHRDPGRRQRRRRRRPPGSGGRRPDQHRRHRPHPGAEACGRGWRRGRRAGPDHDAGGGRP
jgi:leucine dehydrogenase